MFGMDPNRKALRLCKVLIKIPLIKASMGIKKERAKKLTSL